MHETRGGDDAREQHPRDAHAENDESREDETFAERIGREPVPLHRGDGAREHSDAEQAEQPIHHHTERGGSAATDGRFLQKIVALHQIAAGAAGDEERKKQPHHEQPVEPPPRDADALHAQQNLPADAGENFKCTIGDDTTHNPSPVGLLHRILERALLCRIMKNPPQQCGGGGELKEPEEGASHSRESASFRTQRGIPCTRLAILKQSIPAPIAQILKMAYSISSRALVTTPFESQRVCK